MKNGNGKYNQEVWGCQWEDNHWREGFYRGKKDMVSLIEVEDTLGDMDQALEQFTGYGHASGQFIKLDNMFDVIYRNSHKYYMEQSDERMQLFFQILMSREISPEDRADILINGTVRIKR